MVLNKVRFTNNFITHSLDRVRLSVKSFSFLSFFSMFFFLVCKILGEGLEIF